MRLTASWRRRNRAGTILALVLTVSLASQACAQAGGGGQGGLGGSGSGYGGGGRRGQQGANPSATPLPDKSASPRTSDPEAHDAIDLFSRLCVTTQGSRARAVGIIGDGDSAIEKMEPPLLRGLENGQSGGIGWIIRMPLGEKILLEFPPDGSCVVRAPRVNPAQLEGAFRDLLDQYAGSGQFVIKHEGDQTKALDPPPKRNEEQPQEQKPNDNWRHASDKLKYHIVVYTMTLPDTGQKAQLVVATTDAKTVSIQGVLSYDLSPFQQGRSKP